MISDDAVLELARLDDLHQVVWPRAIDGDLQAIDRVLAIMKQRAELLGLNAPQRIALVTSDGEPVSAYSLLQGVGNGSAETH